MFCTKCGTQLEDGTIFCTKCGAKQEGAQAPQTAPHAAPKTELGGGNGYYDGGYGQQNVSTSGMRCPNCGSYNCQILTDTSTKGKDFHGCSACFGAICLGPIGLLCGTCGKGKQMKTKHFYFCPNCGNKFEI